MNIAKLFNRVLVTEKSTLLSEKFGFVTLLVSSCSVTKSQIRSAFKYIFPKAEIKKIRTMIVEPKKKIFCGRKGMRTRKKKVIISFYGDKGLDVMVKV